MSEARRRLLMAAKVKEGGEQARALCHTYYSSHPKTWFGEVYVSASTERFKPLVPSDERKQALLQCIDYQRVHRMVTPAQSAQGRHTIAYAALYDWLYRPLSVTPVLKDHEPQWQAILYALRTLPPWMLPEGFDASRDVETHAIFNPETGAMITRPKMTLEQFAQEAWHVLEPNTPLSWSWHLDMLCQTATMTTMGLERRTAINVPPGSMKSLTFAVFWPAWEWSFNPTVKWLCASHSAPLARRDTLKVGKLIQSEWYQSRFGRVLGEVKSAAAEKIELARGGVRGITSPKSSATGWRADRLLCDDLISVEKAFSRAEREHANDWFTREFSNRLNDPKRSSITLIAQRTHEQDIFNVIAKSRAWGWVVLPTRYRPGRFSENPHDTRRFLFEDERLAPGDLLHPERFGDEQDEEAQVDLGPIGYASQHDQEPRSDGGGLVHYAWMDAHAYTEMVHTPGRWVQVWDLRNEGDPLKESTSFAVGQLWFKPDNAEEVYLVDQERGKWSYLETEQMLRAKQNDPLWSRATEVVVEDKADGRVILRTLKKVIRGMVAYNPGSRAKIMRWRAVLGYWKNGYVHLPHVDIPRVRGWIDEFRREHYLGEGSAHNDQLDTSSMAIHYLLSREVDQEDPWAGWFDDEHTI